LPWSHANAIHAMQIAVDWSTTSGSLSSHSTSAIGAECSECARKPQLISVGTGTSSSWTSQVCFLHLVSARKLSTTSVG
jgi:hypothetical protein